MQIEFKALNGCLKIQDTCIIVARYIRKKHFKVYGNISLLIFVFIKPTNKIFNFLFFLLNFGKYI